MRLVGRAAVILGLALVNLSCEGPPCMPYEPRLKPLIIGDPVGLEVGSMDGSDCVSGRSNSSSWTWHSEYEHNVRVSSNGKVEAIGPGPFRLVATHNGVVLHTVGFALPLGWRMAISPEETTVRVGETVSFLASTYDPNGSLLPQVPFSLFTPEYGHHAPGGALPLVDKYSVEDISEPGVFRAVRSGTTTITVRIGEQTANATLNVVEAQN